MIEEVDNNLASRANRLKSKFSLMDNAKEDPEGLEDRDIISDLRPLGGTLRAKPVAPSRDMNSSDNIFIREPALKLNQTTKLQTYSTAFKNPSNHILDRLVEDDKQNDLRSSRRGSEHQNNNNGSFARLQSTDQLSWRQDSERKDELSSARERLGSSHRQAKPLAVAGAIFTQPAAWFKNGDRKHL